MSESLFIQEARHRGTLLAGSFNPGKAITWVRKNDNRSRILCLQEETRKYLSGESTPQEVSTFWYRLDASPEIKVFISCLDSGSRVLMRQGRRGDIYSIPVLHYVVNQFIHHYLRCVPEIASEAPGEL